MKSDLHTIVDRIADAHGNDPTRLVEIAREIQAELRAVEPAAMDRIAERLRVPRAEVEALVSFYHFLSPVPSGRIVIRLSDDIIDRLHGYERVLAAFEQELGIPLGGTTPDGEFTLDRTACIGMCDQAPAALVNDVVVTELSSDKAREIVRELRRHRDPRLLVRTWGEGNNSHPKVRSMVKNNIRKAGPLLFSPENRGQAIRKALAMSPAQVIREVKTARLRGRGGAGFPTGMKWEFTRQAAGADKFVVCNADEGEPGTFKDRVLLTERPDRIFAGMTIAGHAIGARRGIVYLRGEYAYLREFLEHVLAGRRTDGLLGRDILGREGFDFDIEIRMGAGAYVCGEETALLESLEGRRGDPRTRPPFPAVKGFLGRPTSVNNVETFACVVKILEEGAASFCEYGSEQSTGTKLLSISGDCRRPGIYEVPFGLPLREVLDLCGGEGAAAVQVGGPSGRLVGPAEWDRRIEFEDLATGGSVMVFGRKRDILTIVSAFTAFFAEESCGTCVPCRVGTELLRSGLGRILADQAEPEDIEALEEIGGFLRRTSRCGLGQTAANPVLTSLENFRSLYEEKTREGRSGRRRSFSLGAALMPAERIADRQAREVTE